MDQHDDTKLLLRILDVSRHMLETRAFAPLLSYVAGEALRLVGAERVFIVLRRADGTLEFRVAQDARGGDVPTPEKHVSDSVLLHVMSSGEPLLLHDAVGDPRFSQTESVYQLQLRSVMCAPLVSRGQVIGAVYVENRSVPARFREESLLPLRLFAAQAAVAIENSRWQEELESRVAERTRELRSTLVQLESEIVRRHQVEEELRRLATLDPLTGALNRRQLLAHAESYFARARRFGEDMSALMLDLDHFKRINDTHGHAAGDEVLTRFARMCTGKLREQDLLGRMGGEEFAIILPATPPAAALLVAERIRRSCEQLEPTWGDTTLTVSIGVAAILPADASFAQLLHRADRSLYHAKRSGRDQVAFAASEEPQPAV